VYQSLEEAGLEAHKRSWVAVSELLQQIERIKIKHRIRPFEFPAWKNGDKK
jgi:hypothetical protein